MEGAIKERDREVVENQRKEQQGEQHHHQQEEAKRSGNRRLTDRDRQLLGFLGIARYLSSRQIGQLVFPGRSASAVSHRLRKLETAGKGGKNDGYLRRLSYRTYDGELVPVWALKPRALRVAEEVLGRSVPRVEHDVGADFLEHNIVLNDLLVALAKSERDEISMIDERRFRWTFGESLRLSFSEYDMTAGRARPRLLQPDAMLEFPAERKRCFLECETGTHSIEARGDEKSGSTVAKIARYCEFMTGFAEVSSKTTFYARSFADRWPAELVFLVPTATRRDHVRAAEERWRARHAGSLLEIDVLTFDEAAGAFRACAGDPKREFRAPDETNAPLNASDIESLCDFFDQAVGGIKAYRALVRETNARGGAQPIPDYPRNSEHIRKMLISLKSQESCETLKALPRQSGCRPPRHASATALNKKPCG